MSTPNNDAPSFEQKVNDAVNNMTQGDDGKWQMPEEVTDEAVRFAANLERRRRDTQASYTKGQQELAQVKAERDHFASGWESDFTKSLSSEEQANLEELKVTDPDAWRNRLNELETQQRESFKEKKKEIATKAKGETEVQFRTRILEEWQSANPNLTLNDDVLKNDIPPRITNKLANGEISFESFLDECKDYLSRDKVVKPQTDKAPGEPNLSTSTGSHAASDEARQKANVTSYQNTIF